MRIFLILTLFLLCDYSNAQTTGIFTDPRDGKSYKTVKIGNQTWMAENLNFKTSSGSWCYNNIDKACDIHGRLYTWEVAKNVCPPGWRLPSDVDFDVLVNFFGGAEKAGKVLKSTSGWTYGGNGTNTSGFNALPGGYRSNDGNFYDLSHNAYFWSSSQYGATYAWDRGLYYNNEDVGRYSYNKAYGFSCRCLKD